MRKLYIYLILLFSTPVFSQVDTFMVENKHSFEIIDGKRTYNKNVVNQKTINRNKQVLREFFYDTTQQIKNYIYYYYRDSMMLSQEKYNSNDEMVSAIQYIKSGNERRERYYHLVNNKLKIDSTINHEYQNGLLINRTVLNSNEKWISKATYSYNGTLLSNINIVNHAKRSSSKQNVTEIKFSYDENNNKIKEEYTLSNSKSYYILFEYDSNGRLKCEKEYNSKNELNKETCYGYTKNNFINTITSKDINGKYTNYFMFERYLKGMQFGGIPTVFK
ncbi:MAG: hypothetical protein MI922_05305 [Bacteroidales bacterium]|nr:hypothetical protein [Bacteroidales bacterium]